MSERVAAGIRKREEARKPKPAKVSKPSARAVAAATPAVPIAPDHVPETLPEPPAEVVE